MTILDDVRKAKEIDKALVAISEGYTGEVTEGYIIVKNPDAMPEAIALGGVNPNLVIDVQELRGLLSRLPRQLTAEELAKAIDATTGPEFTDLSYAKAILSKLPPVYVGGGNKQVSDGEGHVPSTLAAGPDGFKAAHLQGESDPSVRPDSTSGSSASPSASRRGEPSPVQPSQSRPPHGEGDYKELGLDGGWQDISTAPLGLWLETKREGEVGTNLCWCRHVTLGDEPEWIAKDGRTTITHHSFAPPTHWRWPERQPADGQPSIEGAVVKDPATIEREALEKAAEVADARAAHWAKQVEADSDDPTPCGYSLLVECEDLAQAIRSLASAAGKGGVQTSQSRSPSNESDYQAPKPDLT